MIRTANRTRFQRTLSGRNERRHHVVYAAEVFVVLECLDAAVGMGNLGDVAAIVGLKGGEAGKTTDDSALVIVPLTK